MPTENKSNKIITMVLAVIITLAAITVIYISLPQNEGNNKTSDENNGQQNGGGQTEESTILTVIYGDEQTNYTLKDLEALESYTGMGGRRTNYPKLEGKGNYTGVTVTTLVELTAGDIENYNIIVYSNDGRNKTYNFSMVHGNVDIYNSTNASNSASIGYGNVTMIASYKKDGKYLNESQDGKLRIAFVNDKKELITSSGLWSKYVASIEIVEQ